MVLLPQQRRNDNLIAQIQQRIENPARPFTDEELARTLEQYGIVERDFVDRVTVLAEQLAIGRITIDQWQRAMQDELRRYHLVAAIIAAGGVALATAATLAIASRRSNEQIGFLNRFANELRSGVFPVDALARLRQRARSYSGAGEATFGESQDQAVGMPRLPAYPKDHQTDCVHNCRCRWEKKQLEGNGNWDCYWILGDANHCEQCPRRAVVWNPLKIRNGVIQPYNPTMLFKQNTSRPMWSFSGAPQLEGIE